MRTQSCAVYSIMSGAVKCSVRKIAEIVGISKSSTHRSMQSMKKRDLHPESYFWETDEGEKWLKLLYYGTIIYFVVYGGIGAERLSRFFAFISKRSISPIFSSLISHAIMCQLIILRRLTQLWQIANRLWRCTSTGSPTWINGVIVD
jgi:hypothetical protein